MHPQCRRLSTTEALERSCCARRDVLETPFGRVGAFEQCVKGNAETGCAARQLPDSGISGQQAGEAARLAAAEDELGRARAARLGVALAGLAQQLAGARREASLLKRENAALRSRLMVGRAVSNAGRHGRAVAQSFGVAQEAAATATSSRRLR